jgi:hypothetical protein
VRPAETRTAATKRPRSRGRRRIHTVNTSPDVPEIDTAPHVHRFVHRRISGRSSPVPTKPLIRCRADAGNRLPVSMRWAQADLGELKRTGFVGVARGREDPHASVKMRQAAKSRWRREVTPSERWCENTIHSKRQSGVDAAPPSSSDERPTVLLHRPRVGGSTIGRLVLCDSLIFGLCATSPVPSGSDGRRSTRRGECLPFETTLAEPVAHKHTRTPN